MTSRRSYGTGSIRQRGKGKYQLRASTIDAQTGKSKQVVKTISAANKTEAGKELALFVNEVSRSKSNSKVTVRELLDEFIEHSQSRGRAARTIGEAKREAKVINAEIGNTLVGDLTARQLDEMYRKLGRTISASSIRRYHAVVSAALNQAVKWQYIENNPAKGATLPIPEKIELVVPTKEEVELLINTALKVNETLGTLTQLASLTGARRGELCAIRWSDLEDDKLYIRHSIFVLGGELGIKMPKSGKARTLVLDPRSVQSLEIWRGKCESAGKNVTMGYMFSLDPYGTSPINPDRVSSFVGGVAKSLGLDVHLHSLRHYAATAMLGAGINAKDASVYLGHSTPNLILEIYSHATDPRQREAAAALADARQT